MSGHMLNLKNITKIFNPGTQDESDIRSAWILLVNDRQIHDVAAT